MEKSLEGLHVAGNNLFHNSISNHVEMGKIAGCPEQDHLQTLQNQNSLDEGKVTLENDLLKQTMKSINWNSLYLTLIMLFYIKQFKHFCTLHGNLYVTFHHIVQVRARQFFGNWYEGLQSCNGEIINRNQTQLQGTVKRKIATKECKWITQLKLYTSCHSNV